MARSTVSAETIHITEPKPVLSDLRTSEIRYRRLFEAARDGILILDAQALTITDANPFMSELLGYRHEEFLEKELWEIGLFKDKAASQEAFCDLQETGYLRYEDLPLQSKDGVKREVEFISNVYKEGVHDVIQCNIRDITARKAAEKDRAQLLQSALSARTEADTANSVKDEFLAILSHELRTPLTAVLGWAHLLRTGNFNKADTERALETIVRNARAQTQIIDDLLDISRIITGKLRLDVRPVEFLPIIETVVDGLRPAANARNIELKTSLAPISTLVTVDPDRIQQIVWNLVTNAIKFTPEGGRVEIGLERLQSHLQITVSDTGQGIAPEFLVHVFERFRQSDSSSTRSHGGLGLGLSIVRELVELHGGTVTARSPGKGKGTVIKVLLPHVSSRRELINVDSIMSSSGNRSKTEWRPSLNGLRVLFVDDDPDARELVSEVLTQRGAEVSCVESAIFALEEMERQPFDVLISDIGMPLMDGYALIKKVRQRPVDRGGKIPAAAMTAYASVDDRMRILSAGYQIHVPKPVEPEELTAVVASLAGRYATPETI